MVVLKMYIPVTVPHIKQFTIFQINHQKSRTKNLGSCDNTSTHILLLNIFSTMIKVYIQFSNLSDDPDPLLTPKVQKLTSDYTRLENLVIIYLLFYLVLVLS
jgi:hypothetical protein